MFIHAVYFWLKSDLRPDERSRFVELLNTLPGIDTVLKGYTGVPAPTRRDVVDGSYSYALVLIFNDKDGHDGYQVHPTHKRFVDECSKLWMRVQVYDSVPIYTGESSS